MQIFDDFFIRALVAGVLIALVAAPVGCNIIWRRMAFFGDTLAHSALLGVVLAVSASLNIMLVGIRCDSWFAGTCNSRIGSGADQFTTCHGYRCFIAVVWRYSGGGKKRYSDNFVVCDPALVHSGIYLAPLVCSYGQCRADRGRRCVFNQGRNRFFADCGCHGCFVDKAGWSLVDYCFADYSCGCCKKLCKQP